MSDERKLDKIAQQDLIEVYELMEDDEVSQTLFSILIDSQVSPEEFNPASYDQYKIYSNRIFHYIFDNKREELEIQLKQLVQKQKDYGYGDMQWISFWVSYVYLIKGITPPFFINDRNFIKEIKQHIKITGLTLNKT